MTRRLFLAIVLVLVGAGCATVGDVYDRWFGSRPAVKPSPLPPLQGTAQGRTVWEAGT
jgi:hypothetical protein